MDILNQMSVASAELRKLNNYPEFKTNAGINSIMVFIQSNNNARIYPNNINTNRKKQRYNEKYNGNSGFVVQNATLFYRKPNLGIDLEVVYPNEKEQWEVCWVSGKGNVSLSLLRAAVPNNIQLWLSSVYIDFSRVETQDKDGWSPSDGDLLLECWGRPISLTGMPYRHF